jgi:hypothetical protein
MFIQIYTYWKPCGQGKNSSFMECILITN